jgi:hypothetical protein
MVCLPSSVTGFDGSVGKISGESGVGSLELEFISSVKSFVWNHEEDFYERSHKAQGV